MMEWNVTVSQSIFFQAVWKVIGIHFTEMLWDVEIDFLFTVH